MKIIEATTGDIVAIGSKIARESGLSNLTIREVAYRAGISVGTVYNLINNKETLVNLIMEKYWQETLDVDLEALLEKDLPLMEKSTLFYDLLRERTKHFHETLLQTSHLAPKARKTGSCPRPDYQDLIRAKLEKMFVAYPEIPAGLADNPDFFQYLTDNLVALIRRDAPDLGFFATILKSYLSHQAPQPNFPTDQAV